MAPLLVRCNKYQLFLMLNYPGSNGLADDSKRPQVIDDSSHPQTFTEDTHTDHHPAPANTLASRRVRCDVFLTSNDQRGSLPKPWTRVPHQYKVDELERLFVLADGSCSGGAVMRARCCPVLGDIPSDHLGKTDWKLTVNIWRTVDLMNIIGRINGEEWMQLMPDELRAEIRDDKIRRECTCKNGRVNCNCRSFQLPLMTWRDERDFLANSCGEPRTAIGFAFFFLAATVLKTGILVLAHSYYPGAEQREVHDFGTETYEKTMIIYASSHGHGTVGHFETVGRSPVDGRLYQTIFPKDDPVIIGIKTWGSHWTNEKTVEEHRIICYMHYPASAVIDHLLASTVMLDSTIASLMRKIHL